MVAEQIQDNNKFTAHRLPTNVKPIHYKLRLTPNFSDFTFQGTVDIEYQAESTTKEIVLHAIELEILDGSVSNGPKLTKVIYSQDAEAATLVFDNDVSTSGTISLEFKGILNDKLKGFYRSQFTLDGEAVHIATTQFEPTDARRCLPCWDEPAVKAKFTCTLVIDPVLTVKDKQYTRIALSNTHETSRKELGDGLVEVTFAETPIMSTYLLAFVVGPFEYIEDTDGKRKVRVYTAPGKKEQGRYALEFGCKSLLYYEEYFDVPFPLPKMDMIAIPDFAFGAMENWGLVTYREGRLLVDEANTSTSAKQAVATVVAHELAHQWFGNLVTMEWWTHLWLNEGFATFMQYLCTDKIFPEYNIWSQFVTESYALALGLDSLHNSHPIEVPVKSAAEINEIFDIISYRKGSAVIRMLYNYIGDEVFRKGMHQYLTKFAYKNAKTEDLWAALEAASGKPICRFMSGWTSQKGYPWLTVVSATEGDNVKLSIEQSKFNSDGTMPDQDANLLWSLPVSVITGSNPTQPSCDTLVEGKTGEIVVPGAGNSWIKLNPGSISLYRASYPTEIMEKLKPAIANQTLPAMDRLGILDDYCALCEAGKVKTVDLLQLLQAFKLETDYSVWRSIDASMGKLGVIISNTDCKDKFFAFGRDLYSEIFKKLTWNQKSGERSDDQMTRSLVINRLVAFEDGQVLAEAQSLFRKHVAKTSLIPADLRAAVYRAVAVHGDDEMYNSLFQLFKESDLSEEKNRISGSVGFAKQPERVKRVLEFALSDEVRDQDRFFVMAPVGAVNPPVAWKFFQDNKVTLKQKYGGGLMVARFVTLSIRNFVSFEKADEIEQFFEANKFPGAERAIQQTLETIRLNAGWLKRDGAAIKAFFSK